MFLQLQDKDSRIADALKQADLDAAPVSPAERAMLQLVCLLTETPARTTDDDVQLLRDAGWNDEQIAECVYITALFAFFNRGADAFGLEEQNFGGMDPSRSH